ncbi:MAG: hypothetical protein RIQ82_1519 [Bacteroidota bacterium]
MQNKQYNTNPLAPWKIKQRVLDQKIDKNAFYCNP